MGMYDTIHVPCPRCGERQGFQTKSGPCLLKDYELVEAPVEVLLDVNRHAPATCGKCGTRFEVRFEVRVVEAKSVEADP